ncbi:hypothetical protein [Actimicrobium sp. CCI2.3]|uniref:hypothetical protein n=1 Tax=Actimicrobium sp. CCI2.3 TaxID=3048616 RepID=UPI002AB5065E|nr:hypothetical protein [Actimicrobium sp. CCI2.3]MDY7574504.1 hypothetical protein [Actimicrobium sp. CCI2.3]MEB0024135.1 hypothetical protein [Actimicrobium sp. CCI2.3]
MSAEFSISKLIRLFFFSFALSVSAVKSVYAENHLAEQCPSGAPSHAPHAITGETCPTVGNMSGVRLAIPNHYLFGPVVYEGVDIWSAKSYENRPRHPTFDNAFDNFAIKIRLNNFKPIETAKDWDDFRRKDHTVEIQPFENRWLYVQFKPKTTSQPTPSYRIEFNNWMKNDVGWGPFVRQPDVWGLQHYISAKAPQPISGGQQHEFFYDAKTDSTFIHCSNSVTNQPPHKALSSCEISFFIYEIKAWTDASNINVKDDLARWKEIESGIRTIAGSFIVP